MTDLYDGELTLEEQSQRLFNVAIKDANHLKRWLEETNRRWIIFDALELVDALPFPDGLDSLVQIIACYRDHRSALPSGRVERQRDLFGKQVEVSLMKTENLEIFELDRVIRYLINRVTELEPTWNLEAPPR